MLLAGMNSPVNSLKLIREHFAQISGLPCWNVHQGYGAFVTFEFGKPSLEVRAPRPNSKFLSSQRGRVLIRGTHHFWIEQCDWRVVDVETVVAASESSREIISGALNRIAGHTLNGVKIVPEFGTCTFSFEHGIRFELERYADFESDDPMWHLYCPDSVISYLASGLIEYGSGELLTAPSIRCDNIQLEF